MSINKIYEKVGTLSNGKFGHTVSIDKNIAIIADENISVLGNIFIYERINGLWQQKKNLAAEALTFGNYLAISGNFLFFSEFVNDNVYLYKKIKENWEKKDMINGETDTNFGWGCYISGNRVAIGAENFGSNRGKVFIYNIVNDKLILNKTIIGENDSDRFGISVSINNNFLAVSSNAFGSNKGKIDIYELRKNDWIKTARFEGENDNDRFGYNISIDGNFVATLAATINNAQKLYVYQKNQNNKWELIFTFIDPGISGTPGTVLRSTFLSVNNNYIIYGEPSHDNNRGKVIIFNYDKGEWKKKTELFGENVGDSFGIAASCSDNYFIIGAEGFSNNLGKIYIYDLQN